MFLPQEAGAFANEIEKGTAKTSPKIEKICIFIFTDNICSTCNPMQVVVLCKFSHLEGSIIP